jgi:hypothetical protein
VIVTVFLETFPRKWCLSLIFERRQREKKSRPKAACLREDDSSGVLLDERGDLRAHLFAPAAA